MSLRQGTPSAALGLLAILILPSLAMAASVAEDCPAGNLLRSARLVDSLDARGSASLVADDAVAVEGAPWTRAKGVQLETPAASLTYDLGRSLPITAAYLQADAAGTYSLQVSEDGRGFREIWSIPQGPPGGRGMRSATTIFLETRARYVRFGEPTDGGSGFVSELMVFCRIPDGWPRVPRVVADSSPGKAARRGWYPLEPKPASRIKLALALLGTALLAWGAMLERRGAVGKWSRLRDGLLLALGIVGFAGYFNWGSYRSPQRVHYHEFYHYFLGAKYFPELGYTGLYECTSLAEAELGAARRVERRVLRDLKRNQLVPAAPILENPERLRRGFTRPFTEERWEEFKRDVAYFRAHITPGRWESMLKDHGYNASPVWNAAGSLLANLGPASEPLVEGVLSRIDPVLLVVAFALVLWAFGWRIACVSALFFGTNDLGSYAWIGGAFLRQDWFLCTVAGLCLLKRGRPMLGGAALAAATLSRVFPVGFFVPVVLRLAWTFARERRIDRTGVRILAGAAVATVVLVPASIPATGGVSAWPEFFRNTAKHAGTTLSNHVGLRTVLTFQWEARVKSMYDRPVVDPLRAVEEARERSFRRHRLLFAVLGCGYLALLLYALRREREWWAIAAFGFGVVSVGLELTCYYYSFLVAAAFFWGRRSGIAVGLVFLSALTQVVTLGTYFTDIRYYLQSVVVVGFVVWATWTYGRGAQAAGTAVPPP